MAILYLNIYNDYMVNALLTIGNKIILQQCIQLTDSISYRLYHIILNEKYIYYYSHHLIVTTSNYLQYISPDVLYHSNYNTMILTSPYIIYDDSKQYSIYFTKYSYVFTCPTFIVNYNYYTDRLIIKSKKQYNTYVSNLIYYKMRLHTVTIKYLYNNFHVNTKVIFRNEQHIIRIIFYYKVADIIYTIVLVTFVKAFPQQLHMKLCIIEENIDNNRTREMIDNYTILDGNKRVKNKYIKIEHTYTFSTLINLLLDNYQLPCF